MFINQYSLETSIAREEIQAAREQIPQVVLPNDVAQIGLNVVKKLGIDSLRAEISLFEAARAYAAADGRDQVNADDLREVAPMALRLRRSTYMQDFFTEREVEENEISHTIDDAFNGRL